MYERKYYLDALERLSGTPLIKVITGMRRVGKSTIMRLYMDRLVRQGTRTEQIIHLDFERIEFSGLRSAGELHRYISARRFPGRATDDRQFLFIDEVQEVVEWERAINSLLNEGGLDIWLTGSNAGLLSSELATLLTGRYVEIPVFPLSFAEYAVFRQAPPEELLFKEFMERGGMPGIHQLLPEGDTVRQYLVSLLDSILLRDVVGRYAIRDVDLLYRAVRFLAGNSGQVFSAKRIADFMKREQRHLGVETVYNYVNHLVSAFLVHRASRYDLKGKRFLEVNEKYYFGDLGLKHALVGYRPGDIATALEAVVYFELRKRGYSVSIGKIDQTEVDFIAEKGGRKLYLQVCYLLTDETVENREFGPLEAIRDNYEKTVLSMDRLGGSDRNGIRRQYLPEFLLQEKD